MKSKRPLRGLSSNTALHPPESKREVCCGCLTTKPTVVFGELCFFFVAVVHVIKTDKNNNQKAEEQHLLQPSWQPISPASSFSTPVQEPVRTQRHVCKDIHIPPPIIQNIQLELQTHFKIQKKGLKMAQEDICLTTDK